MTNFDFAIKMLCHNYGVALVAPNIQKPVSWALYETWKDLNENEEPRKQTLNVSRIFYPANVKNLLTDTMMRMYFVLTVADVRKKGGKYGFFGNTFNDRYVSFYRSVRYEDNLVNEYRGRRISR